MTVSAASKRGWRLMEFSCTRWRSRMTANESPDTKSLNRTEKRPRQWISLLYGNSEAFLDLGAIDDDIRCGSRDPITSRLIIGNDCLETDRFYPLFNSVEKLTLYSRVHRCIALFVRENFFLFTHLSSLLYFTIIIVRKLIVRVKFCHFINSYHDGATSSYYFNDEAK